MLQKPEEPGKLQQKGHCHRAVGFKRQYKLFTSDSYIGSTSDEKSGGKGSEKHVP